MVDITSNSKYLPTKKPETIGTKKAKSEITIFRPFIDFTISSKLISKPAMITNKKTPNSEITLKSSVRCMKFKIVGPNSTPAKISPIMAGCLKRSMISPKNRANTNNSNKLAKKGSSKLGTLNSINTDSRVSYNLDKCIKKSQTLFDT